MEQGFIPSQVWVGQYQTNSILKSWKQENPWLYEIHSQVLQSAIVDLDVAFKNFFEGRAGRPAPKKKFKCQDSFRYPQGFKVEEGNKRIYLPKIGRVRYRNSRDLRGVAKNVTISRHGDKWFASIETEFEIKEPVHGSASQVGVDLGVFRFATESNGKAIEPLNALKKHATRLRRYQRSMSRKVKFSQNWKKAKAKVAKLHLGRAFAAASRFPEALPHFEAAAALTQNREPANLQMRAARYSETGKYQYALDIAIQRSRHQPGQHPEIQPGALPAPAPASLKPQLSSNLAKQSQDTHDFLRHDRYIRPASRIVLNHVRALSPASSTHNSSNLSKHRMLHK